MSSALLCNTLSRRTANIGLSRLGVGPEVLKDPFDSDPGVPGAHGGRHGRAEQPRK